MIMPIAATGMAKGVCSQDLRAYVNQLRILDEDHNEFSWGKARKGIIITKHLCLV